jgi:Acetyl xylan esterase (AXE1)
MKPEQELNMDDSHSLRAIVPALSRVTDSRQAVIRGSSGMCALFLLTVLSSGPLWSQNDTSDINSGEEQYIKPRLSGQIIAPAAAEFQVRQYLVNQIVPSPPPPADSQQWSATLDRFRQHLLNDVAFHGWPRDWVEAPPKFDDVGVIETGAGYRIHKLRYEVVPGLVSAALLYEPIGRNGKMPAILNVHGHIGPLGKAIEFKQKRCINFARHGIIALSLDWFLYGEANESGNDHWFGAQLNLAGANLLGLFYLEMRRGLDYLYANPDVDRSRIGMTGLSGGGWQTIVLSALDERVRATNPVAGFSSLYSRLEANGYDEFGDLEQLPPDFLQGFDYPYLVAMMASRSALLTFNAEDDCCFRAGLVKPRVYDDIRPFFTLYGRGEAFSYHENHDPGTHNYLLDNRLADYRFFSKQFGLPMIENEDGVAAEVRSYANLEVGLPKDNLTILSLSQKMSREITRVPIPSGASEKESWAKAKRVKLNEIIRYKPVEVKHAWTAAADEVRDVVSTSYALEMTNGMSASGMWLRSVSQSSDSAPVTIVLNDGGKVASSDVVADRVARGGQVVSLDLVLMGETWKDNRPYEFAQTMDTLGDRTIGIEAAQLLAAGRWAKKRSGADKVRLEVTGIRSQGISLIAAALDPQLFSEIDVHGGMRSFSYLFDRPIQFQQAPELFCLDLFKEFDIGELEALASPASVQNSAYVTGPAR